MPEWRSITVSDNQSCKKNILLPWIRYNACSKKSCFSIFLNYKLWHHPSFYNSLSICFLKMSLVLAEVSWCGLPLMKVYLISVINLDFTWCHLSAYFFCNGGAKEAGYENGSHKKWRQIIWMFFAFDLAGNELWRCLETKIHCLMQIFINNAKFQSLSIASTAHRRY